MSKILRSIGVIARSLAAISNIEFKDIHLDKDQYLYITRIYDHPGIINDALAELVVQDRTTVAKSVRKLIDIGLIEKQTDSYNKKIRRLTLTQQGNEVYDFLSREEQYSHRQALQGFNDEEVAELERLLAKMQHNIERAYTDVKQGEKRDY